MRRIVRAYCQTAGSLALTLGVLVGTADAGKTLDTIKARGTIKCGVNTGLAGFSIADSQGNWTGWRITSVPIASGLSRLSLST